MYFHIIYQGWLIGRKLDEAQGSHEKALRKDHKFWSRGKIRDQNGCKKNYFGPWLLLVLMIS